jgi:raffinose/stachyose/melibiose transport system permease protein
MKEDKKKLVVIEIILIVFAIIFLYPIFLVIINSFKDFKEVMTNVISFPSSLHFENYSYVWKNINYPRLFLNNLVVTSIALLGIIIFSSLAGFILSRNKSKVSWVLYIVCITPMLIPFQTIMITLIKFVNIMGLPNNIFGLASLYWGFAAPAAVFLYHGFVKGIPKEMDESALVDGASTLKLFFSIIFPLLKPVTSTIIVIDAMWIWNDFLLPLIVLDGPKESKTLTLAAYTFIGQYVTDWQYTMTAIVLAVVPSIIFFIAMQKNIVKGVTAGAVKG